MLSGSRFDEFKGENGKRKTAGADSRPQNGIKTENCEMKGSFHFIPLRFARPLRLIKLGVVDFCN
jgi:hypothetical protein